MSDPYVDRAVEIALRDIRKACAEANLGTLESWNVYEGEQGTLSGMIYSTAFEEDMWTSDPVPTPEGKYYTL